MAKNWWQRTRITRDLAYSMYYSKAQENVQASINDILTAARIDKLDKYSQNINFLKNRLEDNYKKLLEEEGSILDQLIDNISQKELKVDENLGKKLLSLTSDINYSLQDQFINDYNKMNDILLQASDEITKIMEEFRGDNLLYGIGTVNSFTIMTADNYSKFERENRDLFKLQFSKTGRLTGLALTDEEDLKKIANNNGIKNPTQLLKNRLENNENIVSNLFQDSELKKAWNKLKSAQLYNKNMRGLSNEEIKERYNSRQSSLWRARRLEHLFESDVLEGNIQKINKKYSNQENITGFATGDVNFFMEHANKQYNFALQLKYFNGKQGWNGTSVNSVVESLKFFTNKDNIFQQFKEDIYESAKNPSILGKNFKQLFGKSINDYSKEVKEFTHNKIEKAFEDAFNIQTSKLGQEMWDNFKDSGIIDEISDSMQEQETENNNADNDNIIGNY